MNKIFSIIIAMLFTTTLLYSTEKVSVQLHWKYQFEFAGFIAAKEKGFYKDAGFDVELKEYTPGLDIVKDVILGRSTYGVYNSSILQNYVKNKQLKLLGSFFKRSAMVIVTKPEIKYPSDLVGKKIMASSYDDFKLNFKYMFQLQNINTDNLNIVKHSFKIDEFANGTVDAMTAFVSDQLYKLDKANIKYNVINPSDYGVFNLQLELFTSENEAVNHRAKTTRFRDATIKGWEYALAHKNEIIDIIKEKYAPPYITKDFLVNESIKTEMLILPKMYKIGSIDTMFLHRQLNVYANLSYSKSEKIINDFIFYSQDELNKQSTHIDYSLVLQIAFIIFIFIAILIYRQYLLTQYNKKLNIQIEKEIEKFKQQNSELIKKDKMIERQSKLVLMGEMISMIAHQWRQPLNILGTINMKIETKLEFDDNLTLDEYLPISDDITKQLAFMSKTIDDFKDFFNPNKKIQHTNITKLVESSLGIVQASITNKNIKMINDLQSKASFNTFASEVTQVILSIIKNAEDALLENKVDDPYIKIVSYDIDNQHILKIIDNAGGIPDNIINDIFDPYFSTKQEKNGTGLGLYIAKTIIEQHCHGKLSVKNKNNTVVFKIVLSNLQIKSID